MKKILKITTVCITIIFLMFGIKANSMEGNFSNIMKNQTDNYFSSVVRESGQLVKWGKPEIKVYVSSKARKTNINGVMSAIETYNRKLSGVLNFQLTDDINSADVVILFQPQEDNSKIASSTSYKVNAVTYEIILAKVQISDANWSESEIRQIALHEIGHSIGIIGHSDNPNDAMYPDIDGNGILSARDVNTIKMMYGKNNFEKIDTDNFKELTYDALLKNVELAPEKYIVWANLGDYYFEKGNYNEALNAYKTALSKRNVPNNLMYKKIYDCYVALGKTEEAQRYLKYTIGRM